MTQIPPEVSSQLLLDSITANAIGLVVLNSDNKILFHNGIFAELLQFEEISLVGQNFDEAITWVYNHRKNSNTESNSLQKWLSHANENLQFDTELDGRWLSIAKQTHANGLITLLCSDITQQKNAELSLRDTKAEIEVLALTDELTGLANRRYFIRHLEREINRSRRNHHPLCLAILDIDFFKNINDTFGHAVGDKMLMHFSQFLQTHFRASDFVGRLGDAEFAIILPETKIDDALQVVERAINSLTNEELSDIQYSFSAGIASFPGELTIDSNWLLTQADKALHIAKSGGGAKVVSGASD
ncbi:hypothetical protein GCM10011613_16370 [Cellvibrio zantedeschiae]|uniref:diguanylate cyclase n=1 Tax=Cellvibrio zantedeschiae TaxID=1237077 RepID=A0ABQ3B1W1_9GAMM|nr:sensor domain-containing diguanylate cyclase [Cellvibrio zantedeschiae]GGY72139.1 hypothetical protein GCM10011613_16370 [Cellvibrio zantedeschiae]